MSKVKLFEDFNKKDNIEEYNDITKNFENSQKKDTDKYNKDEEFKSLSDDISVIKKLDNGDYEEMDGPFEIVQINGIIKDENEINKIENQLSERVSGAPVFNTDLQLKTVKRGEIIWVTALLQRPGNTSYNAQTMGVIKCRVVDYFYGLNKLKSI